VATNACTASPTLRSRSNILLWLTAKMPLNVDSLSTTARTENDGRPKT